MEIKEENTYIYDTYIKGKFKVESVVKKEGKTFNELLEEYFKMMLNKEFN